MAEITAPDTLLTPHQGQFLAPWLTLEGSAETTLFRAIASARVDLNPHQVDAALFALHSPLSQGVVLADRGPCHPVASGDVHRVLSYPGISLPAAGGARLWR